VAKRCRENQPGCEARLFLKKEIFSYTLFINIRQKIFIYGKNDEGGFYKPQNAERD
jgi:hypothetical protein